MHQLHQLHQPHDRRRSLLATAVVALSALLSACGGGGGGGDAASMSLQSSTPSRGASLIAPDNGVATATVRIHGFSNPSGSLLVRCGDLQVAGTTRFEWKASQELLEFTLPYDGLPRNSSCVLAGEANASNATGPNTVTWSIPFTTGEITPLHYGPLLVGVLGDRTFALDFNAGAALKREPARTKEPGDLRLPPAPYLFGTALTNSGRIPLAALASGVAGPVGVLARFNPLTLQWSVPNPTDPMPEGHELGTVPVWFDTGWQVNAGGIGPAPTPTAKFWAADGAGGWFYVDEASQDTLRRRTAAGTSSVVHTQTGERFGSLRVFSH